jgi:hypothetical protein
VSWLGYDGALVSRRLMQLYGNRPHRILPPDSVPDGFHPPALTVVDWARSAVVQSYLYPDGTTTIANQFIPRRDDEGGWVGVYLVSPKRQIEYWLFDAADVARGPIARIGCADLRPERTIHHTWTAEAPARRSTYRVPLSDDLGGDWRHLPAKLRQVVETALRLAGE